MFELFTKSVTNDVMINNIGHWCCFSAGKIQEVILQEHLKKEDEVLVSLAGLKQVNL